MFTRFKNVLVTVVTLFLFGVSSQAAICELVCELPMQTAECHATSTPMAMADAMSGSGHTAAMGMDHSHCLHSMRAEQAQAVVHTAGECHTGSCSHTSVAAFNADSPSAASFVAVQWVTVSVVPVDLSLSVSYLGTGQRPPLPSGLADPVVVSLRV